MILETDPQGNRLDKWEELGYFQHGGSISDDHRI
jgi:hypothetical protein